MAHKVLIIGQGGREHALAWKMAQSPQVSTVVVAPGNPGTALLPKVHNVSIDPLDFKSLAEYVKQHAIAFTLVGPEAPLAAGIVDYFESQGLLCFGPSQACAQLEASKAFSKAFMKEHGIPTARYETFHAIEAAKKYVRAMGTPIVIKASGLAAGKGVIIAETEQEAFNAIDLMLGEQGFGDAGTEIVIEEFLKGTEASFIVMIDGEHAEPFATSQDHKTRDNGDQGPNTGGMGAYSPAPIVTKELEARVMREVIAPVMQGFAAKGLRYCGFLYAGLMITEHDDFYVLEFNCRLGDPETQPLLMRLQSDLYAHCWAALHGKLKAEHFIWDPRPALGVVMVAAGYPDAYKKGDPITGLDAIQHSTVFHAGTAQKEGQLVTQGGRVLCVTALGDTLKDAQMTAYDDVKKINWNGCHYRTDIGNKAFIK